MDWVEPSVCTDEHIGGDAAGLPLLRPWSVPRLVADVRADSAGDGKLNSTVSLPGKLLINTEAGWRNDGPLDVTMLIRVTRSYRSWLVSNPNYIQFRDRWTYAVDRRPETPTVTGIYNSQAGSAIDLGTNSVAEPLPGREWVWTPTQSVDEWVARPLAPGERFDLRYRAYVWTPPAWSDNANKSNPQHEAAARWARIQLFAYPRQGTVVR